VVEIQTASGETSGARRSIVSWSSVRSPSRARSCFGRARRLAGQNRVPEPPARINAESMRRESVATAGTDSRRLG
jgi:hypothetical protein